MLLEDTWHFWAHRTCHVYPQIYKTVHKMHHSFPNPFGAAAEYASMAEQIYLGIGFFLGLPLFWDQFLFIYVWLLVRIVLTTEVHLGYDVPLFCTRFWLPYWTGARHHDFHHKFFNGNYAPTFIWWDRWTGSEEE